MNGTLLFRRSASIVLISASFALGACGVELNGLFQDDGGNQDAAPRDAGRDADATADRALDIRVDEMPDRSSGDVTAGDGGGNDATVDPRFDGDATREPNFDVDARNDPSLDGDATVDVSLDADAARDVGPDDEGPRDTGSDPLQDPTAEDAADDPRLDVAIERPVDAVVDAVDARGADADADAEPPMSCTGSCNTFANISPTILRTVVSGPTPTMTGGNIVDGTYVVTNIVHYNGDSSGFSLSETSVIAGNMDAWVASTNGNPTVRYTTTFTTSNNQMEFSFCCPGTGNLTIMYTTNGSTLSYIDTSNPNRVITFTRQ